MPNTEILRRADDLLNAVERLTAREARNRRIIAVLVGAVLVMLVTMTVTGYSLVRVAQTSTESRRTALRVQAVNDTAARNLCQSRNESSAKAKKLWDDVLRTVFVVPATAPAAQRARIDDVVARLHSLVDGTYIQRDCTLPLKEINR